MELFNKTCTEFKRMKQGIYTHFETEKVLKVTSESNYHYTNAFIMCVLAIRVCVICYWKS